MNAVLIEVNSAHTSINTVGLLSLMKGIDIYITSAYLIALGEIKRNVLIQKNAA